MKSSHTPAFTRLTALAAGILFSGFLPSLAVGQTTGWNQTAGGTYDYNNTANWVNGEINGIWDAALTLAAPQTIQFGADTVLSTALDFQASGSQNITLQGTGGARTITLGGNITSNVSVNKTVTIGSGTTANNLNVNLGGATRTFTAGTNKTLNFQNVISNGGVTTYGGTVNFYGVNTYTGTTTVNSGILSLNGASGSVTDSDFTVNATTNSTNLLFNSSGSSSTGITRAKSVTLNGSGGSNGAILTAYGNTGANSIDTITNAITAVEGYGVVGVSATGTKNAQLAAGSFSREAGSSVLFRSLNLGVNTLASLTAGSANISFATAPALSGGGSAGTTTIGIIHGAYGDSSSNSGDGKTGGLVTYDSTYGVRLLNTATEYTAGITSGQIQADNVLYQRASGGASQDTNLAATTTTINSLSFKITGAGTNSGVTISGDAGTTLKISSGAIFASQQVTTAVATDAMTLSVPTIDLNGKEGVIQTFTNGVSNGNTSAPLYISSVISNDGGNGVTFGGTGETILNGADANTYTGVTTINSGILRLAKTTINTGLTTDLVMNGGALLKNSNAIADSASVTINGGTFYFDTTTSSGNNNHQETINNFTMNGGGVANHGTGAAFTINGNATLNAGTLIMNQGGDVTVGGTTTLNGGLLTARESTSTSVFNGLTSLNTVNITNQASGAYTAIKLTGHATNKGALLTLNGNVTFTGNGTNTNTVLIDSTDGALANQGVIALEGTRTFNVGNGAAADDLTIVPTLQDGVATGGLTKTGLGTLALGGTNTYSGNTTISAGTLKLGADGSLANSPVINLGSSGTHGTLDLTSKASFSFGTGQTVSGFGTINIGAGKVVTILGALAPGNSPGIVSVTGDLTLGGASTTTYEIAGRNGGAPVAGTDFDQTLVSGTVTFAGTFNINTTVTGLLGGDTFQLFNAGAYAGHYDTVTISGTYSPTLAYNGTDAWTGLDSGSGLNFSFSEATGYLSIAIPEPSSYAAIAAALALGGAALRRRRC